jgi:outer membrane protein TolC
MISDRHNLQLAIPLVALVLWGACFPDPFIAAAPVTSSTAQSVTQNREPVSHTDRTFLEFLKHLQETSTSPLISTATVALIEGMSTATAATTIPAWLAGPTTGTVEGTSLPLSLDACVSLALRHNFGLQNSRRDVAIAASSYRQEVFEFVPFVDLFSGYTYADSKTGLRDGSGLEQTRSHDVNVGMQAKQNFPTGGDLSIRQQVDRTRTTEQARVERVDPVTGRVTDVSHPSATNSEWSNSLDVTARQPLLRGGGLAVGMANLRLARLGQIEANLGDQIKRRDLVLSVIRAYFTILQRQLDARVSLDAIREKKRFYDETVTKHELGEIAESEIWRAKIQWLQEQQRSRQLQQSFLDSLDSLLILMGMPLETSYRLREFTGQVTDLPALGLTDPESCVREALANRPDVVLAEVALRRARINVETARNGTLPFLDIEASYGDKEAGTHLRDVRDPDERRTWSLGALFDIPFPNVANREALKRARLRLEKAETDRKSLERDITEEVRRLHRALLANRARVDILAETVALAERSLQLENARFYYGENTSTEVRQAQDDLFQARTDYNNAMLRYQSDLANLYRAIGRRLYQEQPEKANDEL